jgi:hypothetical protein
MVAEHVGNRWRRAFLADERSGTFQIPMRSCRNDDAANRNTSVAAAEDMNEKRNVDWTVVLGLAARAGPRELVRALTTAMEHECTALAEKYDASLARQRADYDEILAQQRAEFEQRYAVLKRELFAKIDNELGPVITALRRELAAANAELDRLRATQPAH